MMDTPVLVHVDLRGMPLRVGRLWIRVRGGRESASFEYDPAWMDHPLRFALEPALTVGPGPYHTRGRLFGSIGDSAPDRWGRVLLRRAEVSRARSEGRAPRTLFESDFLLRVDDEIRIGALRFSTREEGPFLAEAGAVRVPPLVDLRRLMAASRRVLRRREKDERSAPAGRSRFLPRRHAPQGRGQGRRRRAGAGEVSEHGGRPGHRALGRRRACARRARRDSGARMATGNRCRKANPGSSAVRPRGKPSGAVSLGDEHAGCPRQ